MKQELETLKNNELQYRWKIIVSLTCQEYRYRQFEEAMKSIRESIETFSEKVKECFDSLFYYVDEIKDILDYDDIKSYSHFYPHSVHNYKVNTRGFPRPINRCARSRCK